MSAPARPVFSRLKLEIRTGPTRHRNNIDWHDKNRAKESQSYFLNPPAQNDTDWPDTDTDTRDTDRQKSRHR